LFGDINSAIQRDHHEGCLQRYTSSNMRRTKNDLTKAS